MTLSALARWSAIILVTLVILAAIAVGVATVTWRRGTARQYQALAQRLPANPGQPQDRDTPLPAPVARYLALAIPRGGDATPIRTVRVRWAGAMRLQPDAGWSPFTADQQFTVDPPGFLWDASVRMMPLVPVRVRDSYIGGEGAMLGQVGGIVTVVNQQGSAELAASALVRWLGETVWFPTAWLPGGAVSWTAVDDSTARATVTDGSVTVTAEFHFGAAGEPSSVSAMRYRDVNGTGVLTAFEGRYQHFERREGFLVPGSAEVAWILPQGRFPYWRGRPQDIRYR